MKSLDGFADSCAAYAKLLCQFTFGRKLLTRLQSALVDGFLDLLHDLLIQARGTHHFVHDILPNQNKDYPTLWYDRRTIKNSTKYSI